MAVINQYPASLDLAAFAARIEQDEPGLGPVEHFEPVSGSALPMTAVTFDAAILVEGSVSVFHADGTPPPSEFIPFVRGTVFIAGAQKRLVASVRLAPDLLALRAVSFLRSAGGSVEQAIGIVANIFHESGFNTAALGDNGTALGLCQWRGERQNHFQALHGLPLRGSTFREQLSFILWELANTEAAAAKDLASTSTVEDATRVFCIRYERPAEAETTASARVPYALALAERIGLGTRTPSTLSATFALTSPSLSTVSNNFGKKAENVLELESLPEFKHGHLLPGRPSVRITQDGKTAVGYDGLAVEYAGSDNCPYGISATKNQQPFSAVVLHHTAPDHDIDWYVQYQIRGDKEREGHFGYHFYISPDGRIVQGAPLTARTNHISPNNSVRKKDIGPEVQNTNSIGISCVGAGKPSGSQPSEKQKNQISILTFAICDAFDIPFTSVYGHGEIQTNRMKSEGASLAQIIRSWSTDLIS